MIIIAILLVTVVVMYIRNAVFPLPIAWAYFGIYQFLNAPEGFKGAFGLLQNMVLEGVFVLVALSVIRFYRNGLSIIPKPENETEVKK